MKTFYPRNISGSWFGMSVYLGPFTVSVIQLVILAGGLGVALSIRNGLYKSGSMSQGGALVVALPVFAIFAIIAFFEVSELNLLAFIAKMIRTNFLDTPRKFQINRSKPDPLKVMIGKLKKDTSQENIIRKKLTIDHDTILTLNKITD